MPFAASPGDTRFNRVERDLTDVLGTRRPNSNCAGAPAHGGLYRLHVGAESTTFTGRLSA